MSGLDFMTRVRAMETLRDQKLALLDSVRVRKEQKTAQAQETLAFMEPYLWFGQNAGPILESYNALAELNRDIARTTNTRDERMVEFQRLTGIAVLEGKALKFYSSLLDDITRDYVQELEKSLNRVYTYVFQKPNKSAALRTTDRYNKKVLTLAMRNIIDGKEHFEPLGKSGFSVSVVLGTVLLIYFIVHNNLERIIFFDETFTGLADDTASRFFEFLRMYVDLQGFRFMLISHESRFREFADRTYFVRNGRYILEKAPGQDLPPGQFSINSSGDISVGVENATV